VGFGARYRYRANSQFIVVLHRNLLVPIIRFLDLNEEESTKQPNGHPTNRRYEGVTPDDRREEPPEFASDASESNPPLPMAQLPSEPEKEAVKRRAVSGDTAMEVTRCCESIEMLSTHLRCDEDGMVRSGARGQGMRRCTGQRQKGLFMQECVKAVTNVYEKHVYVRISRKRPCHLCILRPREGLRWWECRGWWAERGGERVNGGKGMQDTCSQCSSKFEPLNPAKS